MKKRQQFKQTTIEENFNVLYPTVATLESLYEHALRQDQPFHKLKEIKMRIRDIKANANNSCMN